MLGTQSSAPAPASGGSESPLASMETGRSVASGPPSTSRAPSKPPADGRESPPLPYDRGDGLAGDGERVNERSRAELDLAATLAASFLFHSFYAVIDTTRALVPPALGVWEESASHESGSDASRSTEALTSANSLSGTSSDSLFALNAGSSAGDDLSDEGENHLLLAEAVQSMRMEADEDPAAIGGVPRAGSHVPPPLPRRVACTQEMWRVPLTPMVSTALLPVGDQEEVQKAVDNARDVLLPRSPAAMRATTDALAHSMANTTNALPLAVTENGEPLSCSQFAYLLPDGWLTGEMVNANVYLLEVAHRRRVSEDGSAARFVFVKSYFCDVLPGGTTTMQWWRDGRGAGRQWRPALFSFPVLSRATSGCWLWCNHEQRS